jgi:ADP-dependent NAD(P)H-hydrate dehydratase / NAD(P)H-hydrate epimerase
MATGCADQRDSLDLYSVAQVRAIEAAALSSVGPGILMQRAGAAVARHALTLLPEISKDLNVLVAAGPGNNGGDALEAAALLAQQGIKVTIIHLADEARLAADARRALTRARQSKAVFLESIPPMSWSLAIDGMFGIGLTRPLEGPYRELAQQLNRLNCPLLAIDVPSGLDADTGGIVGSEGLAVRADETITFIANKPGLHTLHGRDNAGRVVTDDLSIDPTLFPEPIARLNSPLAFADSVRPRLHASHKGSYGDLQVIGGAEGMSGAVILAARMALIAGAGRVFAGFAGPTPAYDSLHPELMCRCADDLHADQGVVVIGPGLGMSRQAHDLLGRALSDAPALVIDADGLNLIAAEPPLQARLAQRKGPSLLTPHPLEAARLLGTHVHAVQSDRLGSANTLADRYYSTVILKGSGSIIAHPGDISVINATGNPALATAGSGDVLAGLCGALLAQGWSVRACALASTWLHGSAAGEMVASGTGPIGATASELMPWIRKALNKLVSDYGARP